MSKYVFASTIQKQYEISSATLWRWDEEKKIETIRAPGGKRLYNSKQVDKLFQREDQPTRIRKKVCYARVGGDKQREDLERQIQDLREAYQNTKSSQTSAREPTIRDETSNGFWTEY